MFKLFRKRNTTDNNLKIVYENRMVKNKILSLIRKMGFENVSDLLIKLGFNKNEIVYLYVDCLELDNIKYSFMKNDIDNRNIIRIDNVNSEISISNRYLCKNYKVNGCLLDLYLIEEYISDKITLFHRYGVGNSLFVLDNGDYELTLEICLNLNNGYLLSELEVINSRKLGEYLSGLKFPFLIEDIYSDISKILNLDQSMFEVFDLVVTKDVDRNRSDIVLDEILIRDGYLERITKEYEYGSFTLNKDGSFSYDKFDRDIVFSVKYNDKFRYRYNFLDNSLEKNGDFNEIELFELRDDANIALENTKKLVKRMFNM